MGLKTPGLARLRGGADGVAAGARALLYVAGSGGVGPEGGGGRNVGAFANIQCMHTDVYMCVCIYVRTYIYLCVCRFL